MDNADLPAAAWRGYAIAAILAAIWPLPTALAAADLPVYAPHPSKTAKTKTGTVPRGGTPYRQRVAKTKESGSFPVRTRNQPWQGRTRDNIPPGGEAEYVEVTEFKDGKLVKKRIPVYGPNRNTRSSVPQAPRPYPGRGRRSSRSGSAGAAVWVGVFIFLTVMVIVFVVAAAQSRRTTESYSQLARRYRGTCDPGGWARRPKVSFTHAGSLVVVDVYSTGGEHPTLYTQVHFHGLQTPQRCEVYPEGMWARVGKLMGMEDVLIGSPDFDDRYIIKGASLAVLRDLLSPAVQEQIERLRQFLGNGDIYVLFDRRELLVKKRSFIRDYHTLAAFTQLAIELYERVLLAMERGIEFVEDAAPPKITEAVCQICGETIQSDVVFCRRCKTPHHQDCWQYYGACSTYGCRETRYLRPTSRRAARQKKEMHQ